METDDVKQKVKTYDELLTLRLSDDNFRIQPDEDNAFFKAKVNSMNEALMGFGKQVGQACGSVEAVVVQANSTPHPLAGYAYPVIRIGTPGTAACTFAMAASRLAANVVEPHVSKKSLPPMASHTCVGAGLGTFSWQQSDPAAHWAAVDPEEPSLSTVDPAQTVAMLETLLTLLNSAMLSPRTHTTVDAPLAAAAHAAVASMLWCVSKSQTNLYHELPMTVWKAAA